MATSRKPTLYHVLLSRKGALYQCGTVEAVTKDQARSRARKLDGVEEQLRLLKEQGDLYVIPATSMVPIKVGLKTEVQKEQTND